MAKHAMNWIELRQRINNLKSIRDGLKFEASRIDPKAGERVRYNTRKLNQIKLTLDDELRDVRTVYYGRLRQDKINRDIMAGL